MQTHDATNEWREDHLSMLPARASVMHVGVPRLAMEAPGNKESKTFASAVGLSTRKRLLVFGCAALFAITVNIAVNGAASRLVCRTGVRRERAH